MNGGSFVICAMTVLPNTHSLPVDLTYAICHRSHHGVQPLLSLFIIVVCLLPTTGPGTQVNPHSHRLNIALTD
jgi:hypothetical protein